MVRLVVTGATGLLGQEMLRQALSDPKIDEIVSIARRETALPEQLDSKADASKLKSVILKDWTGPLPAEVLDAVRGAHVCIWLLAITPPKRSGLTPEKIEEICHTYTMNCLQQFIGVVAKPFRIVYVSGLGVERDQTKKVWMLGDYMRMRGRVETDVLAFAAKHEPDVEAIVARPGFITAPGRDHIATFFSKYILPPLGLMDWVHVTECAAALLEEAVRPEMSKSDPISNEELRVAGRRLVKKEDYLQ